MWLAAVVVMVAAQVWATRAVVPPPSVAPRYRDPITAYASGLVASPPRRYENLSLFLVRAKGLRVPNVTLPLNQAVAKGLVEVTELKDAEVNRLRVRSQAKEPVFVMGGEMLRGGKQDRIMADDLVLPPRAEVAVAVYCVEHGRWALGAGGGARGGFTTGHSVASAKVRQSGGGGGRGGGQEAVWSSVAEQQENLKAPSATGALRSVHDSVAVRDQIAPHLRALSDLAQSDPRAVGVVAMVGGEVLAADLFSSATLFRRMYPDLLESYAIDAVEREAARGRSEKHSLLADAGFVTRWLGGLKTAGRTPRETPGAGEVCDLAGRDFCGSALVWNGGVVHAGLLSAVTQAHMEREPRIITPGQRRERMGR
jgi:hypothetical protein